MAFSAIVLIACFTFLLYCGLLVVYLFRFRSLKIMYCWNWISPWTWKQHMAEKESTCLKVFSEGKISSYVMALCWSCIDDCYTYGKIPAPYMFSQSSFAINAIFMYMTLWMDFFFSTNRHLIVTISCINEELLLFSLWPMRTQWLRCSLRFWTLEVHVLVLWPPRQFPRKNVNE